MNYRLWAIFYVFALVAAAMATFGPGGVVFAAMVLLYWVAIWKRLFPTFTRSNWIAVGIVLVVLWASALSTFPNVRRSSHRTSCANNLKQIELALLNHESAKGVLPPAYIADARGKPMHSWRVLILPYLGEMALYNMYNFNEPWNGPNNSKLASQIPDVYRCPAEEGKNGAAATHTNYLAVVGNNAAWPGRGARPIRQFTDGTSNTITVMEAGGLAVHWMEPRDVSLEEAVDLLTKTPRSGHLHVDDGFLTTTYYETPFRHVGFCDGSVHWMGQLRDSDVARALLTADGGEVIPSQTDEQYVNPKATTVIKWGKVWGLSIFVLLTLLPAAIRQRDGRIESESKQDGDDADEQKVGVAEGAKAAI